MVEEELKKFVKLFPDIALEDIKNNKNFNLKQNLKISDVIFSQLLPSITNMLEITKKNDYAIEIIELFHEKYIYLTEDKMETLFLLTKADKEEIERMKNEYIVNNAKTIMMNEEKTDNINIINDDKLNIKIDEIIDIKENNKINLGNDKEKNNLKKLNKNVKNKLIINEKEKNDKNKNINVHHIINDINIQNKDNIINKINVEKIKQGVFIKKNSSNKNLTYNNENFADIKNNKINNSFEALQNGENKNCKISQNLFGNNNDRKELENNIKDFVII